jgi:hypothetical protein
VAASRRGLAWAAVLTGVALVLGFTVALVLRARQLEPAEPAAIPSVVSVSTARVSVTSEPAGATLFLDGTRLDAVTPMELPPLAVGTRHLLQLELPGHAPLQHAFTVAPSRVPGQREALELVPTEPRSEGPPSPRPG